MPQDGIHRGCERGHVAVAHDQSSANSRDDFAAAAVVADDDGRAAEQRLEGHQAKDFVA